MGKILEVGKNDDFRNPKTLETYQGKWYMTVFGRSETDNGSIKSLTMEVTINDPNLVEQCKLHINERTWLIPVSIYSGKKMSYQYGGGTIHEFHPIAASKK